MIEYTDTPVNPFSKFITYITNIFIAIIIIINIIITIIIIVVIQRYQLLRVHPTTNAQVDVLRRLEADYLEVCTTVYQ